jgi:hypothetical protein
VALVFRQSDRSLTTRRGYASRTAAQAARAAAIEDVRRGDVIVSRGTFGEFWAQLLEAKRPYVTAGTLQDYMTHGSKRLLPWFGDLRLGTIDEDRVRDWIGEMSELVADGELSAKTVNNARNRSRNAPSRASITGSCARAAPQSIGILPTSARLIPERVRR